MSRPTPSQQTIETKVLTAVKSTINKFRRDPAFFFTESDLHSYLYHKLYEKKSRDLQVARSGQDVYLVHREYPTNFRYTKAALLDIDRGYELDSGQGYRGHYDVTVLNPDFVQNHTINHVANKNVQNLIDRQRMQDTEAAGSEVLFAFEFKYMVRNSSAYALEVKQDNRKLRIGLSCQVVHAFNLVFCNDNFSRKELVEEAVKSADGGVISIFVQSTYNNAGPKARAVNVTGNNQCWASWLQGKTKGNRPAWLS